eukprot:2671482-Rhodomonas_salina.3
MGCKMRLVASALRACEGGRKAWSTGPAPRNGPPQLRRDSAAAESAHQLQPSNTVDNTQAQQHSLSGLQPFSQCWLSVNGDRVIPGASWQLHEQRLRRPGRVTPPDSDSLPRCGMLSLTQYPGSDPGNPSRLPRIAQSRLPQCGQLSGAPLSGPSHSPRPLPTFFEACQ